MRDELCPFNAIEGGVFLIRPEDPKPGWMSTSENHRIVFLGVYNRGQQPLGGR